VEGFTSLGFTTKICGNIEELFKRWKTVQKNGSGYQCSQFTGHNLKIFVPKFFLRPSNNLEKSQSRLGDALGIACETVRNDFEGLICYSFMRKRLTTFFISQENIDLNIIGFLDKSVAFKLATFYLYSEF